MRIVDWWAAGQAGHCQAQGVSALAAFFGISLRVLSFEPFWVPGTTKLLVFVKKLGPRAGMDPMLCSVDVGDASGSEERAENG